MKKIWILVLVALVTTGCSSINSMSQLKNEPPFLTFDTDASLIEAYENLIYNFKQCYSVANTHSIIRKDNAEVALMFPAAMGGVDISIAVTLHLIEGTDVKGKVYVGMTVWNDDARRVKDMAENDVFECKYG